MVWRLTVRRSLERCCLVEPWWPTGGMLVGRWVSGWRFPSRWVDDRWVDEKGECLLKGTADQAEGNSAVTRNGKLQLQ